MGKFMRAGLVLVGMAVIGCLGLLAPAAEPTSAPRAQGGAVSVRLEKTDAGWQLLRDGKPYFIKGAGGDKELKTLARAGGNSLRTWGADNLGPLLDQAHELGLTVTVGIWLGHEQQGFNYNDAGQVAAQYEKARQVIDRYKDHPAVLLWGIGNEMEGNGKGDNAAIWSAVNNIAVLAKKLDPNHPTMTVLAEVGGDRVKNVHRLCPDIDIVGINSYGGVTTLAKRYREAGGTKPYILTEFGPPGPWEVNKHFSGAVLEPTSADKAGFYRRAYEQAVVTQEGLCLGSYAFLWGHKQEGTATWFGMLLPDGSRLAAVDTMTELWTGKPPANRCPTISGLNVESSQPADPGATVRATLDAADPEGDPLQVRWVLQADGAGEGEAPPTFPEAIVKTSNKEAEIHLPQSGGVYRLYAYVRDDHGGAATANVPVVVRGPVIAAKAKRAELPLVVYDEGGREHPAYVPTGWMGNTKALKLDESNDSRPHAGKTCLRVDYTMNDGWGGVVWQHPANDWGDRPGGWDLSGAKELTFWARGEQGGEVVNFEFGILGRDKKFPDSAGGQLEKVKLTTDWKQYRMDLRDKDLSRIKTGFVFSVAAPGQPVTFYLDDIRYE